MAEKNARYTAADDATMFRMYAAGASWPTIGLALGRTAKSVSSRYWGVQYGIKKEARAKERVGTQPCNLCHVHFPAHRYERFCAACRRQVSSICNGIHL